MILIIFQVEVKQFELGTGQKGSELQMKARGKAQQLYSSFRPN